MSKYADKAMPRYYRTRPFGRMPQFNADGCINVEYTDDEVEFLKAIDRYKRDNHRPFPTWKEVLDVLKSLGWRKW